MMSDQCHTHFLRKQGINGVLVEKNAIFSTKSGQKGHFRRKLSGAADRKTPVSTYRLIPLNPSFLAGDFREKGDSKRYAGKACKDICHGLGDLNSLEPEDKACDDQDRDKEQAVPQ